MSSQLDINSLFETSNHKTLRRLETYDNILKKCHTRIKYYSKFEKTTCFFVCPCEWSPVGLPWLGLV